MQTAVNSYPPMPRSKIDLKYIPIDPLYLPRCRPSPSFGLGEDISRTGAGTRYIGIMARDPTLAYISLCQDTTLSHYSRPFLPDDIIDPETCNVLMRCMRLEERYGCCGKKSFYCSKLALLNDDGDDKEETFGEYVQSTKQLKKIRRQVEMLKKKDPIIMTTEAFPP